MKSFMKTLNYLSKDPMFPIWILIGIILGISIGALFGIIIFEIIF